MIKILPESQGSIIGLKIEGRLNHEAYRAVVPFLEERIRQYGMIRLLLDLKGFEGWRLKAAIDDMFFSLKHRKHIERIALVLEKESDRWASMIDRPFTRGVIGKEKCFRGRQIGEAWDWICKKLPTGSVNESLPVADKNQIDLKIQPHAKARMGSGLRVLIVGKTPVGYLLSLLLAKRGIKPTLSAGVLPIKEDWLYTINPIGLAVLKGVEAYERLMKKAHILVETGDDAPSRLSRQGPTVRVEHAVLIKVIKKTLKAQGLKLSKRGLKKIVLRMGISQAYIDVDFEEGASGTFDAVVFTDNEPLEITVDRIFAIPFYEDPLRFSLSFENALWLAEELVAVDQETVKEAKRRFEARLKTRG